MIMINENNVKKVYDEDNILHTYYCYICKCIYMFNQFMFLFSL